MQTGEEQLIVINNWRVELNLTALKYIINSRLPIQDIFSC